MLRGPKTKLIFDDCFILIERDLVFESNSHDLTKFIMLID